MNEKELNDVAGAEDMVPVKRGWKKKYLGLPVGLIVLIVAGLVIASMITYIATIDIEGSKVPVLEIRESTDDGSTWGAWTPGEELTINWDFGTVVEYQGSRLYQIQTTSEYDAEYLVGVDVTFSITDVNDALTVVDKSDDSVITDAMVKTIPQTGCFEFEVTIDISKWLSSGYDYNDLSVEIIPNI